MSVRRITARYAGTCGDCGATIAVGDEILFGGRGRVACTNGTCSIDNVAAGPTTRERKAARAERLREWAEKREARSHAAFARANSIADMIPMGQPILVGHHSERRHRRDLATIDRSMHDGVESARMAESMLRRAESIETDDVTIYSDDPDAIERLEARIAELEAKQAKRKAQNATYRREHKAELAQMTPYQRHEAVPWPSYSLSNLSANINRNRKRLAALQREARV